MDADCKIRLEGGLEIFWGGLGARFVTNFGIWPKPMGPIFWSLCWEGPQGPKGPRGSKFVPLGPKNRPRGPQGTSTLISLYGIGPLLCVDLLPQKCKPGHAGVRAELAPVPFASFAHHIYGLARPLRVSRASKAATGSIGSTKDQ